MALCAGEASSVAFLLKGLTVLAMVIFATLLSFSLATVALQMLILFTTPGTLRLEAAIVPLTTGMLLALSTLRRRRFHADGISLTTKALTLPTSTSTLRALCCRSIPAWPLIMMPTILCETVFTSTPHSLVS